MALSQARDGPAPPGYDHDRNREEVIVKPTFQVETPEVQVTTPHWMIWAIDTQWDGA